MKFKVIAKKVLLEKAEMPIEERLCPDQYVGVISTLSSNDVDFPVRMSVEDRPTGLKCVVMILESPHIDEFSKNLGPAKGKTGRLIREHILQVEGLSNYNERGLVLMNAIQYQCSLGYRTDFHRDDVFVAAWEKGARNNFISRLNKIFLPGDVIVNCCTKGKLKNKELRQLVQKAIPSNKGEVLRRTHPSSWYSAKNRNSQWKLA